MVWLKLHIGTIDLQRLVEQGYIVYANDHRGHGKAAASLDEVGYIGPDGTNRMVEDMKDY